MKNTSQKLREIISIIDTELSVEGGTETLTISIDQLRKIRVVIQKYLEELGKDNAELIDFGLRKMIVDSWPYDSVLGKMIINAETSFLKFNRNKN